MPFYPTIKDETVMALKVIQQSLEKDPTYLENSECPYSEAMKAFFRKVMLQDKLPESKNIFEENEEVEVVDNQIQKILSDLEAMGAQMLSAEPNERLNYFKTKTSLLEKLITMRERVFNLREMNDFRNVVIETLDRICTKDQITTFMKSLDGVLGVENQK